MSAPACVARHDAPARTWCQRKADADLITSDVVILRGPRPDRVCPDCLYALFCRLAQLDPTRPRIVAYGGRNFDRWRVVWDAMDLVHRKYPRMILLNGKCPLGGADRHAEMWARDRGVPLWFFPPLFEEAIRAGKSRNYAFHARNDAMARARLTGAVEFPGARGTKDMRGCLKAQGLTEENGKLWCPRVPPVEPEEATDLPPDAQGTDDVEASQEPPEAEERTREAVVRLDPLTLLPLDEDDP